MIEKPLASSSSSVSPEDATRSQRLEEIARDIEMTYEILFAFLAVHPSDADIQSAWDAAREQVASAVSAATQGSGWREINSTPTNGRWFLGWNEDCGHFIWRDGPGLITGEDPAPTHWMPLPDPPPVSRPPDGD